MKSLPYSEKEIAVITKRNTYTKTLKDFFLHRVLAEGEQASSVRNELSVPEQKGCSWVKYARKTSYTPPAPMRESDKDLRIGQLEAELREARQENEFLGKAAAFFAKKNEN